MSEQNTQSDDGYMDLVTATHEPDAEIIPMYLPTKRVLKDKFQKDKKYENAYAVQSNSRIFDDIMNRHSANLPTEYLMYVRYIFNNLLDTNEPIAAVEARIDAYVAVYALARETNRRHL